MPKTNQENYTEQIKALTELLYERGRLSENTAAALLREMYQCYLNRFTEHTDKYQYATEEAPNFSNKVKGEKRVLNANDIIALERVSGMSFDDIIKQNWDNKDFKPRGIRYAASCDSYELFEELHDMKGGEEIRPIECFDEYSKDIFDYVIEYKSYTGLRFLIEKEYVSLNNGLELEIGYSNEAKVDSIFKMLLESENAELFIQLVSSPKEAVWLDERHYADIIKSEPALICLLKPRKLESPGCMGIMPICLSLLEYAHKNGKAEAAKLIAEAYNRFIDGEIERALSAINRSERNSFYALREHRSVRICVNGEALFLAWDVNEKSPLSTELNIQSVDKIIGIIAYKSPCELCDGERLYEKDFYYVKCKKTKYIEMLEYMTEQGFLGTPRLLGEEDGVYKIERVTEVSPYEEIDIAPVAEQLGKLHALSERKLGKDRVYAFGTSFRRSLGKRGGKYVLAGEGVKIGEPVSELTDLILFCTDIQKYPRNNEELLTNIKRSLELYRKSRPIERFGDEMIKELDKRLATSSKRDEDYASEFEQLYWAKSFVEIYRDELNEI